jgi:hypothetical protein
VLYVPNSIVCRGGVSVSAVTFSCVALTSVENNSGVAYFTLNAVSHDCLHVELMHEATVFFMCSFSLDGLFLVLICIKNIKIVKYTLEQQIFLYDSYVKKKSNKTSKRTFLSKYPGI